MPIQRGTSVTEQPPPVQAGGESWWYRVVRSNAWLFASIGSAIITLVIGYIARQVLVGVTTATFLGSALLIWMGALAYTIVRIHEPVRLMTQPRVDRGTLEASLENAKNDMMTELGYIVLDQASADAEAKQRRIDASGVIKVEIPVVIHREDYKMDEETFREIEVLVQAISFVRFLREMLAKGRVFLSRAAALLPIWWPIVLVVAFFVAGLPQDFSDAVAVTVFMFFVGLALWTSGVAPNPKQLRDWHHALMKLHDLSYTELKAKLKLMVIKED